MLLGGIHRPPREDDTMHQHHSRLRRIAGTAALATLALATIGTGVAGAAESGATGATGPNGRGHLTATQRECLKDQGITKPTGRPTAKDIKALKAAAKACDIPLGRIVRHRMHDVAADLTDAQKQCLKDAGITKPEGRPTVADLKAFAEAAKSCDIPLRDHHRGPELTDAQRQCLTDAGITKPEGRPTEEQRAAFRAAAESCGITLPAPPAGVSGATGAPGAAPQGMPGDHGRRGPGERLTDAQRQCLADAGITRPTGPPTEEQRAAMRSAAESCGITLGRR